MTENYRRLGLIYRPLGSSWHTSHCQNPFVQPLTGSRYRVHFAGRDEMNRSRGGWVEIENEDGRLKVRRASRQPSLELGRLGAFDDAGAMPGSLIEVNGRLLLYYTGWTLARAVPFLFFIGLAESYDGGETFSRVSEAPILGRNRFDPFLTGAPWVINERGTLRMWYVSGTSWLPSADNRDAPVHYYSVKHATSTDGMNWETSDRICLPYEENEHAIARPVVIVRGNAYEMIYSARRLGEKYRIYSATSRDGLSWQRKPHPLIDISDTDWESEMVCYGSRLESLTGKFILYNGNAYGRDGFGALKIEEEL